MGERVRPVFRRGRPLTKEEVEELLYDLMEAMEDAVEDLAAAALDAGHAEAEYRTERAKAQLLATHKTDAQRAAHATFVTRDLLEARNAADARREAAAALWRIRVSEMDGLRSINANARAAETGHA